MKKVAKLALEMIKMRLEGAEYKEIGDHFGFSAQHACRKIRVALRFIDTIRDSDLKNPPVAYRNKYDLTQGDMARRMNMSQPNYCAMEKKSSYTNVDTMNRISSATDGEVMHFDLLVFRFNKLNVDLLAQAKKRIVQMEKDNA